MKKLISILCVLFMTMFVMVSCNDNGATHPVVGHNFATKEGNISFYFATDYTVKNTIKSNGNTTIIRDLTYKIVGDQVEIYFGNTDYWKESARGTLFTTFKYNSSDKSLYSTDFGTIYYVN